MPILLPTPTSVTLCTLLHISPAPDALAAAVAATDATWDDVLALAQDQRILSYLSWNLTRLGVTEQLTVERQTTLREAYFACAVRNAMLFRHFREVVDAFSQAGIPLIVLKGIYLADQVYPSAGARLVGDIDLVVPPARANETIDLFTRLGFTPDAPFHAAMLEKGRHLPSFQQGELVVELHFSLTDVDSLVPLTEAELWERAVPAQVADRAVLVLAPEDQLLHLCIHGAIQHQMELDMRFLVDIAVVCGQTPQPDWDTLVARACRLGWARAVWLALTLAQALLGAPVPATVFPQLLAHAPDDAILQTAIAKLFSPQRNAQTPVRKFAQIWDRAGDEQATLHGIWARLFLPRSVLAHRYHVAPDSPWLPLYYGARGWELLRGYGPILWQMWRGDPVTRRTLRRARQFHQWVTTPETR